MVCYVIWYVICCLICYNMLYGVWGILNVIVICSAMMCYVKRHIMYMKSKKPESDPHVCRAVMWSSGMDAVLRWIVMYSC